MFISKLGLGSVILAVSSVEPEAASPAPPGGQSPGPRSLQTHSLWPRPLRGLLCQAQPRLLPGPRFLMFETELKQ